MTNDEPRENVEPVAEEKPKAKKKARQHVALTPAQITSREQNHAKKVAEYLAGGK